MVIIDFLSFMAAISKLSKGNALFSRLKALVSLQKYERTFSDCGHQSQLSACSGSVVEAGAIDFSKWRKLDSRNFGISRSMIPLSPWIILNILRSRGFDAYLVGGCVRDLILNRIPKDFDIITNATLPQIRKQFHRCEIVGRRFPICRVHIKGSIVEVSSFDTVAKHAEKEEKVVGPKMPKGYSQKDFIRWNNSMHRDFTINSLFFDPLMSRIYDYTDAMLDLRSLKLRTLVPAHLSFGDDCARILRGLRLAARLNLSFTKEIEDAIHGLSSSIMDLSKPRLMMEVNYMMSYGAAEPSLSLLRRYNILEILFPFHGAYLAQQASKQSGENSVMLMKLFSSLDQLVTCGQPSHDSVWVALLAFHLALVAHPQHAFVILTFASVLYRANWLEGVNFAEKHSGAAAVYAPEVSDSRGSISDDELAERVAQLAVHVQNSINILTDTESLLEAMSKFPGAPCCGLVFVSRKMGNAVELMLDILVKDITSLKTGKESFEIDYDSLGKGHMRETRFLLGRVILDTIAPGAVEVIKEENIHGNMEIMEPKFVCEDDKENYERNKEGGVHFLDQKLERAGTVDKIKNEGDHCQLPKDEIRTLLEEVKHRVHCQKKKNDEKHQKVVVNHLNLLLKGERGSLREYSSEEVNEKSNISKKHNSLLGKKLASGGKGKHNVRKVSLSVLFR